MLQKEVGGSSNITTSFGSAAACAYQHRIHRHLRGDERGGMESERTRIFSELDFSSEVWAHENSNVWKGNNCCRSTAMQFSIIHPRLHLEVSWIYGTYRITVNVLDVDDAFRLFDMQDVFSGVFYYSCVLLHHILFALPFVLQLSP